MGAVTTFSPDVMSPSVVKVALVCLLVNVSISDSLVRIYCSCVSNLLISRSQGEVEVGRVENCDMAERAETANACQFFGQCYLPSQSPNTGEEVKA